MRKLICTILTFALLFTTLTVTLAFEEESNLPNLDKYDSRIWFNGSYLDLSNIPKLDDEKTSMLPLRLIFESNGNEVKWIKETNKVEIKLTDGQEIHIDLNTFEIRINGEISDKKIKIKVVNGVTFVGIALFEVIDSINAVWDSANKTTIISTENIGAKDVVNFSLGEVDIGETGQKEVKCEINGGLALPQTKNNPIVFVLHGAHAIEESDTNRYDLGYSYLLKQLAEKGYLAISINVNMQYSFEEGEPSGSERILKIFDKNLDSLKQAISGKDMGYGVDLTGKGDLSNITLIGHSRSGQEILKIGDKYKDDASIKINGLLSIAPAYFWVMDFNYPDIPTAFILPELDGDVVGLDGQRMYDEITVLGNRESPTQLIYLNGANHNAFNEAILKDDMANNNKITTKPKKLDRELQREFIKNYTLYFLNCVNENPLQLENLRNNSSGEVFGEKALISNSFVNAVKLIELDSVGDINKNKFGAEIIFSNVNGEGVLLSYMQSKNTAGTFNHPGSPKEMNLLKIWWENRKGSLITKIPTEKRDFSEYKNISFYIAQDSTSDLNKGKNQAMTIEIRDRAGKSATRIIDGNTPELSNQKGEIYSIDEWDGSKAYFYSTFTPLSTLSIQLKEFSGINLSEIESIALKFDQSDSGCIMIKNIELIK